MALVKCKECGHEISKQAKICPNCGAKPRRTSLWTWLIAIFFGPGIVMAIVNNATAPHDNPPPVKQEEVISTSPVSKWEAERDKSSMDDSDTVLFKLNAEGKIYGWHQEATPVLVVRCHEKKTDVIFVTGMDANPELGNYKKYTVRLRLDDQKPEVQLWHESTDNEALFAPNPIILAKKLAAAQNAILEFTPFRSGPVQARFNLTGLNTLLPEISKTCKWKS